MRAEGVLRALLDRLGVSAVRTARKATPSRLTTVSSSEAMVVIVNVGHYSAVVCSGASASPKLLVTFRTEELLLRLYHHQDLTADTVDKLLPLG